MKRLGSIYNKTEEYIAASMLLTTSFILFYQVVLRYVFSSSVPWIEEVARYLVVWLCMLGASMAVRDKKHAVVDILVNYLGRKARAVIDILCGLICVLFCAVIAHAGWGFVVTAYNMGSFASTIPNLPLYPVFAIIPLGLILMCIRYLLQVKDGFLALMQKDSAGKNAGGDE